MFISSAIDLNLYNLQQIFLKCTSIDSLALGGSRARGNFNQFSDYDLFCINYEKSFKEFRNHFIDFLMNDCHMVIAAEEFYLENWGYLFKAFDKNMIAYDISIVPDNRIDELGIKSSNIILFDKSGSYLKCLQNASDDNANLFLSDIQFRKNTINKIVIDLICVKKCILVDGDCEYWEVVKYLERIRRNVMILMRMNENKLKRKSFSPEKNFCNDIDDKELRQLYSDRTMKIELYEAWKKFFVRQCSSFEKSLVLDVLNNFCEDKL